MFTLLIPVAAGVEASVKRQLKNLGYGDCPAIGGRVRLSGDWSDIARLNVFLRAGERVLLSVGEFPARSFDELFDGISSLPWEEFLTPHAKILMDGKSVKSTLAAIKAAGGVAKKAILKRLQEKLRVSRFDESGERAIVGLSIVEDIATVTLDTSGDGLHKRGYRTLSYDAPLRETTAAAMIESSFYRADKPFADLFCGSGTLPIEAALYALNIAPGIDRDFDFTRWKCSPVVLDIAREEAKDLQRRDVSPVIFASDLNPQAVSMARYHAKRAGVEKCIRFSTMDMRDFQSELPYGVLISNPPYGERIGKRDELFALYRDFSRVCWALPNWSTYFITAYAGAERAFGRRADKVRTLYNANLECRLYSYFGKKPPREKDDFPVK
ncbi:MAG: class I SAM-dependent RNA methyltransferase [Clostridiales bacterium]|nr:class I SAM-dependent RNA methyltransferase [Clostridiales bacterium]